MPGNSGNLQGGGRAIGRGPGGMRNAQAEQRNTRGDRGVERAGLAAVFAPEVAGLKGSSAKLAWSPGVPTGPLVFAVRA